MIRSSFTIQGFASIDNSGKTKHTVKILSPKKRRYCSYCHTRIVKGDWYSVSSQSQQCTFYCGMKCMWISSRNEYREFEDYVTVDTMILAKPIKQNVPQSLVQTTTALKTAVIYAEIAASNDTFTKLIGSVSAATGRQPIARRTKKRLNVQEWMDTCMLIRDLISKKAASETEKSPIDRVSSDIIFDDQ